MKRILLLLSLLSTLSVPAQTTLNNTFFCQGDNYYFPGGLIIGTNGTLCGWGVIDCPVENHGTIWPMNGVLFFTAPVTNHAHIMIDQITGGDVLFASIAINRAAPSLTCTTNTLTITSVGACLNTIERADKPTGPWLYSNSFRGDGSAWTLQTDPARPAQYFRARASGHMDSDP